MPVKARKRDVTHSPNGTHPPLLQNNARKRGVWPPCTKYVFLKLTTHLSYGTLPVLLQKAGFNIKLQT